MQNETSNRQPFRFVRWQAAAAIFGWIATLALQAGSTWAAGPLDGEWIFLRDGTIPLGADYSVVSSDSSGTIIGRRG